MPAATKPWEQEGSAGVKETLTFALPSALQLTGGRRLEAVEVAYETYGTLSEARDNSILICHALSGDAHVAGWRPGQLDEEGVPLPKAKPGWWDIMVGPGKTFDTDRYFVISSNVLGGCMGTTGPGTVDPATGTPYALRFPIVTVEDMVSLQSRLLDHLGVDRLLSVIGGSMGGMQALAWPKMFPDRVASVIADATTPRLGAQAIAFNEVGRRAILEDPNFNGGDYYDKPLQPDSGLAIARMVGHITYLSDASMRERFGRKLRERNGYAYDFVSEFEVESYLGYKGRRFVERFDANTYLYMTKAMDYFDLRGDSPTLADALRDVRSRFLVLSFTSDWLFPTHNARELVSALRAVDAEVSFAEITSPYGHDAFLLEPEEQDAFIRPFLATSLEAVRS